MKTITMISEIALKLKKLKFQKEYHKKIYPFQVGLRDSPLKEWFSGY